MSEVKRWMLELESEGHRGKLVPHEFGGWVDLKDYEALDRKYAEQCKGLMEAALNNGQDVLRLESELQKAQDKIIDMTDHDQSCCGKLAEKEKELEKAKEEIKCWETDSGLTKQLLENEKIIHLEKSLREKEAEISELKAMELKEIANLKAKVRELNKLIEAKNIVINCTNDEYEKLEAELKEAQKLIGLHVDHGVSLFDQLAEKSRQIEVLRSAVNKFLKWFSKLPEKHTLFTEGKNPEQDELIEVFKSQNEAFIGESSRPTKNATHLDRIPTIEVEKTVGSPNLDSEEALKGAPEADELEHLRKEKAHLRKMYDKQKRKPSEDGV